MPVEFGEDRSSLRGPVEFAKGRVRNGTERSEVRAEWSGVELRPEAKLDRFEPKLDW